MLQRFEQALAEEGARHGELCTWLTPLSERDDRAAEQGGRMDLGTTGGNRGA